MAQTGKNPPAMQEGSIPGLGKSPGGGHGNPLQYSCLEIHYGQRSLAGYSPWGRGESDMTERLSTAQHSTKPSVFPTSADTKTLKVKLTPNKHLLSEDIQE